MSTVWGTSGDSRVSKLMYDLYLKGEYGHDDNLDALGYTVKAVEYDKMYTDKKKLVNTNYFEIKKVIFHNPATIVIWVDGSKTVVKCQKGDTFDPEKGLAMAISKRAHDDKGNFNDIFKKWVPKE